MVKKMTSSSLKVLGIHHITAIASDPQKTVDFYTKILGLRLVKKSVNQDQTEAYHLFFGDRTGEPGMDLTFFTFPNLPTGQHGVGQVTKISLAVAEASLEYWRERFETHQVKYEPIVEIFGKPRLVFYDFDGQCLELVGIKPKPLRDMTGKLWKDSPIPSAKAIRCFYSARLTVSNEGIMGLVLVHGLGYERVEIGEQLSRFALPDGKRAVQLEVEEVVPVSVGTNSAGTVHHIAFSVADEAHALKLRDHLTSLGLSTTEVIDRYYFKSIYFRTPSGILFELATMGPGFTVDEPEVKLGHKLALPPFLESRRTQIESQLIKLK